MSLKVYFIYAHPSSRKSQVNAKLRASLSGIPFHRQSDLYEEYPDFQIDIEAEKEKLMACDAILFQHPFYWYSSPPLLKHWFDEVLEIGFAYGPGGHALQGKRWLQAITTGGSEAAYSKTGSNRYSMSEYLRPFEQTAHLCGMIASPPFIVHSARKLSEAELPTICGNYRNWVKAEMGLKDGV